MFFSYLKSNESLDFLQKETLSDFFSSGEIFFHFPEALSVDLTWPVFSDRPSMRWRWIAGIRIKEIIRIEIVHVFHELVALFLGDNRRQTDLW